jgi:hypothetical protein
MRTVPTHDTSVEHSKAKDNADLCLIGEISFKKQDVIVWTGLDYHGMESGGGLP